MLPPPPLIDPRSIRTCQASEHVTELLLQLCVDTNNRGAIAKAGAIQKLVMQLRSKSPKAQELAAAGAPPNHEAADGFLCVLIRSCDRL